MTPPGNLHLTLAFLGEVGPAAVEGASTAVAAAAVGAPSFAVRWGEPGVFPSKSRPRVFWLGVDADARLGALHGALVGELVERALPVEARPYRPHLTLARLRRREVARARLAELVDVVAAAPVPPAAQGTGVVLYSSNLGRGAAVHRPLLEAPLAGF